jgi:hypothetical protein
LPRRTEFAAGFRPKTAPRAADRQINGKFELALAKMRGLAEKKAAAAKLILNRGFFSIVLAVIDLTRGNAGVVPDGPRADF